MIRWYDYVLAVVAAYFIVLISTIGITATTWWEPLICGLVVGSIWDLWSRDYCAFRLKQEKS